MIRLNLLPWREDRRRERKQQFQRQLGLMGALGLSVVLAVFVINTSCIGLQEERNQLLSAEIAKLDVSLREIQQLQQQIASLNARRTAVERLQIGRTYPVRDCTIERPSIGVIACTEYRYHLAGPARIGGDKVCQSWAGTRRKKNCRVQHQPPSAYA